MSSFATFLVAASVVAGPAPVDAAPAADPASPSETQVNVEATALTLVVEASPEMGADFMQALALRLRGRTIVDHRQPRETDRFVYARARTNEEGLVELTLITPDGRAFDRELEAEPEQRTRVAASALANLVFSVESGNVEPDRTDVPIPAAPEPQGKPESEAKAPAAKPPTQQALPKPRVAPPPGHEPPPPALQLGPTVYGGALLGVAPPTRADVFAGGGGGVGLDVRLRSGTTAMLDLRILGRGREGIGMTRFRIGAGAGYTWRWEHAELILAGALTVEPWILRRDGSEAPLEYEGAPRSTRPLIGGLARLSPGWIVRPGSSDALIRIGPRVELAGSFVVDDGARTVDVGIIEASGDTEHGFRLGGLELMTGIEIAAWFGIEPRRGR